LGSGEVEERSMRRGIYIGRFQPFHNGHMELLRHVMKTYAPGELLIGIGSAQVSHTLDNPFTAGERFEMVEAVLRAEQVQNCRIVPIPDLDRHALWVSHVVSLVPPFEQAYSSDPLTKMLFSEAGYETPDLPMFNRGMYEGKEIRRRILAKEPWEDLIPTPVRKILEEIQGVERLRLLAGSKEAVRLDPNDRH
jgi:nicotinamide-nucleotide adenylyltransferase